MAKNNGSVKVPAWAVALVVSLLLSAGGFLFGYGMLTARVDAVQEDVTEIKADVKAIQAALFKEAQP